MSYTIRIATEKDFQTIHKLNRQFADFIQTPEKFTISIEQMFADQDHFRMFVAETQHGEIVGFATTFIAWYSWIGKSFYLDDLYVIEKHRGRGLGSQLMDEVLRVAKKEKCKKVKWMVSRWNKNAIDFYRKKGAVIDQVEISCDLILEN